MKDKDLIKRLLFPYMAKMFLSAYSYKDYTFDTKRYLKEPRFIGVLLGIVYDHQHAIKDKDEHYALSL